MKKILRNGMLIIIAICITTYLVIGVTSIYRSNINKHNNLLNNVDDELVYDNKNNSTAETKDNSTNSDKNTNNNSNKDDSNKNNSSNSNKNNSSSNSSKNNSSSNSNKNNSSSSSSKNNSSSNSNKNNSSSSSSKNNSSSSSSNNSSSSSNKNNSSSSSNNNSSNSNNNNSSSTKPSQTVKVTGVSLNKTSAEIYLNNDTGFSVSATVSPSNATNKNITWSSSNSNIASVNNGYITAHNPGAAIITVKTVDGNKQASINVVVKKKVIVIIGASQVTRMVWYKNSYSSSKYNVDNGTLVYVNESGTGIDWQNTTGISRAKNIIEKYSSYKNYTYFYVFFPLSGNTIQSFSCDEISSTNSTIKKFASGYNTSIQSIKNSGYNVKGYVASMHPVRVSQRGNNTKIVTNEDSNSCTKSYRSNYKYYKFNLAMKSIVESSYSNNLKYEPIFIQIMDTKQGKKVNFSYKITYNTTDGMHWDSNTTNTYVNMMLGYISEL